LTIIIVSRKTHMSRYIYNLISQGEHQQLDFKYEISDVKKIARTLVAFSNTDGGKLLIGVKDNGNITGIHSEEEYYMIEAAAQMYCRPEVRFAVMKWNVSGKSILEIDIPKAPKRPFFALNEEEKWMAYIRKNDQNLLANKILLKVWEKENRKKGSILRYTEKEKILLHYLEQNNQITLLKFCRIARISNKLAEEILSTLICFRIIDMEITEKSTWYLLKKQE
jgi:predicted HTH transcriptional regulator